MSNTTDKTPDSPPETPSKGRVGLSSDALFTVLGMDLPIIEKLPHDYVLVAHPNGFAIADKYTMSCPSFCNEEIPDDTRTAAIDAMSKWATKQPAYPVNA